LAALPDRRGPLAAVVALIALVRPGQSVKTLLVVPLPLLDRSVWSLPVVWRVLAATAAFVVASSLVYVINDITDRHRDRAHPTKCRRPLASGRLSVRTAVFAALALGGLLVAIVCAAPAHPWPLMAYVPLNVLYCYWLKHLSLVDAFTVATGFALRVLQGYVAAAYPVSVWLVLAVFAGCLLVSLGRRQYELNAGRPGTRPALAGYSAAFIDQIIIISAMLTATAILLYLSMQAPIQPHRTAGVLLLGPIAIFAVFRYLQVVVVKAGGADAVRTLVRDPAMIGSAVVGLCVFGALLAAAG
jgi:4-hydroxybenzoate polyprenyltransferase